MEVVKLRRRVNEEKKETHTIVALKLNRRQISENRIESILHKHYDEPITTISFIFIGDLNQYKDYQNMLIKLNKTIGGRPVYRNYCVSLQRQLQTLMFVNVCEDVVSSWNTVKCALGAMTSKSECLGALAIIIHKG